MVYGNTGVGKSALITSYLKNTFSDEFEPTVLCPYEGSISVSKKSVDVSILDTSGDKVQGDGQRAQSMNADGFMICVACSDRDSFGSIEKWMSEIQGVAPEKPIFLILTKNDLEDSV